MVDKELSKRLSKYKLIAGDFNTTLKFARDTTGYLTDPHSNAKDTINGLIELGKYVDIYEYFHTGSTSYTWVQDDKGHRRNKKTSRIDHILVSRSLSQFCQGIKHKYTGGLLNHNAIILTMDWCQTPRGPGTFTVGVGLQRIRFISKPLVI